ncbi:ABC transporter ATP-binding protein [Shinella sp. BYT-45]|uniref:ABC transporter ATP-binding protein n=1 Tax=Shinella sp. BYT-45 TaxID=3377377 RepID=UPI00397F827C
MESTLRGETGEAPKIRLRDVSKTYVPSRGGAPSLAVSDISLDVRPGEFLCIVGPSGSGKSTIMNMIAGLTDPSGGLIEIDGRPVAGPGRDRGVVFQDYALFPWKTVRENIEFGPRYRTESALPATERNRIVDHYIRLVGLAGAENKYPHELSGGMRQRCAFARALANEPAVLLMDEPFAALDAQTRLVLQEELLRIWGENLPRGERRTVVFITHGIDEAVFLADRVVVLDNHPGTIRTILDIDLPRPRTQQVRKLPRFQQLADDIWSLVRAAAYAATLEAAAGQ